MTVGPRTAGVLALGALAGVSITAYVRVFTGTAWLAPALAAGWLPIALVLGLRRAGLGRRAAAAITLVVGAAFVAVVLIPRLSPVEAGLLLELRQLREGPVGNAARAIADAWAALETTFTPAPPTAGLLGILLCAAWAGGVVSAAFLGESPPVAAHAWIALFVFAAAVGTANDRQLLLVAFLASLLALLFSEAWMRTGGGAGRPRGVRAAAGSAAVAVAAAAAVPSLASGYLQGGPRLGTESPHTTVISPIVQILPRLNDRTPRVLFTVEADRPAYWRLTALDRFDGSTWSAAGEYGPARDGVRLEDPPGARAAPLRQRYTIARLGGIWVPAAYAPSRLSGIEVSVDPVRGTLATDGLQRGDTYTVLSDTPAPTTDLLRRAGTRGAPEGSTQVPVGLPPLIGQMASAVAGRARAPYDQVLAIQSFLRTFDYRQDIPPGHSGNYLVHFLTELKAGYCEQFAGSMAVMLRTLGIPARVAVGFLPGVESGGRFVVGSEQAHAWPEVWFRDIGWIPFEPTPRSGLGPPSYAIAPATGTAQPGGPSPATPAEPDATATPAPGPSGATATPSLPAAPDAGRSERSAWATVMVSALSMAGLAAMLMAARAVRLRAWTVLVRAPAQRVASAWQELLLRGADAWRPRRRAETEQEYAGALVAALGIEYELLRPLVASRQRAAYAAHPPGDDDARAAAGSLRVLRRRLLHAAGWSARLRLLLSPRPLLPRRSLGSAGSPIRPCGRRAWTAGASPPPGGGSGRTPRGRGGTPPHPGRGCE